MKANCFRPQKELEARAEAHFGNYGGLELPWRFPEAYKHTLSELKRRAHFHRLIKYVMEKLEQFLERERKNREM